MNKKDKNSFMVLLVAVIYLGVAIGFIKFTKYINPYVLFGISAILQCFFLKPQLIENYYKLYELPIDKQRFIPIVNEFAIFPISIIKGEIIFAVCSILVFAATQLPLTVWSPFFGNAVAINMPFKLLVLGLVLLFISSAFRGVGYIKVARDARNTIREVQNYGTKKKESLYTMFGYVSFMFPVVRILGLIDLYNTLNTAVKLKGVTIKDETKEFEEVEG